MKITEQNKEVLCDLSSFPYGTLFKHGEGYATEFYIKVSWPDWSNWNESGNSFPTVRLRDGSIVNFMDCKVVKYEGELTVWRG